MNDVLSIIEKIALTPKTNEKIDILKSINKDNIFFNVCELTYSPRINFGVKEYPEPEHYRGNKSLDDIIKTYLPKLNYREITGNSAIDFLVDISSELNERDSKVLRRIINRDLGCGISKRTINKVYPDLIYEHPYMRCSSFNKKNLSNIIYPCFSQIKMDGLYCDIIVSSDNITAMSRNGNYIDIPNNLALIFKNYDGYVLQGELIVSNSNGYIDRSKSNGILNSGDINWDNVRFFAWDMIPKADFRYKKCSISYFNRFSLLRNSFDDNQDFFSIVETSIAYNESDIKTHFENVRFCGLEGTVIKNYCGKWKDGTSKDMVKVKVEAVCELKVVGINEGSGKYVGQIGSLICESKCGNLKVSVSGLKDSERKEDFEKYVDKIISVKYNDVISNQLDENKKSLFLPRFLSIRTDKDEADDLEEIYTILNSFSFTN